MSGAENKYLLDKAVEVACAALSATSQATKPVATRPGDMSELLKAVHGTLVSLYLDK